MLSASSFDSQMGGTPTEYRRGSGARSQGGGRPHHGSSLVGGHRARRVPLGPPFFRSARSTAGSTWEGLEATEVAHDASVQRIDERQRRPEPQSSTPARGTVASTSSPCTLCGSGAFPHRSEVGRASESCDPWQPVPAARRADDPGGGLRFDCGGRGGEGHPETSPSWGRGPCRHEPGGDPNHHPRGVGVRYRPPPHPPVERGGRARESARSRRGPGRSLPHSPGHGQHSGEDRPRHRRYSGDHLCLRRPRGRGTGPRGSGDARPHGSQPRRHRKSRPPPKMGGRRDRSRAQEGEDKLASPEEIAAEVLRRLADSPWAGRRVTVIGGGSRESIDSVRSIANESTGETAVALAVQAHLRGAQVDLWLGAHTALVPPFLSVTRWRSVRDLANLARGRAEALRASALVIVPAALADYTTTPEPGKISSRARPRLSLRLDPAPKLLPLLRTLAPPPTRLVGFKLLAETDPQRLRTAAEQLAREAGADAIVANGVESIGNGRVRALWVTPEKVEKIEGTKVELADRILDLAEPSAGLDPVQTHASGLPAGRAPRGPRRARTGRGSAARSDPR